MADYVDPTLLDFDPKEPITSEKLVALRDNPTAIIEGADDAPRLKPLALGPISVGDTLSCGAQVEITLASGTSETALEFNCMQEGSVRVKGQYKGGTSAVDVSWSVYRVRAGVSTLMGAQTSSSTSYSNFTDVDVTVQYGDLITVTVSAVDTIGGGNGGNVRNVSIHTDGTQPIWTTSNFGYIYV
jgi:hypothetical protein